MVIDSRIAFTVLVALLALQRLWELRKSARHEAALLASGGREHAAGQMRWMRALHASWMIAMIAEVWMLDRAWIPRIAIPALGVFALGQTLRLLAMHELGPRWTVKIMTIPGAPPIAGGIFSHLRHPNYLGVILEIAALPLVHGAWITSVVFSIANAVLLRMRIRAEERALDADNGYQKVLGQRPRFIPKARAG